jgi:hypothetical protein
LQVKLEELELTCYRMIGLLHQVISFPFWVAAALLPFPFPFPDTPLAWINEGMKEDLSCFVEQEQDLLLDFIIIIHHLSSSVPPI